MDTHAIRQAVRRASRWAQYELRPADRDRDVYDYVQAQAPDYFPAVVDNASLIFEVLFAPEERIVVVRRRFRGRRSRFRSSDYWLRLMAPSMRATVVYGKPRRVGGSWQREAYASGLRSDFDHRRAFRAVAHADFSIAPSIGGDLIVVSAERAVTFRQYDDRGAYVHTEDARVLERWPPDVRALEIDRGEGGRGRF